MKNRRIIALAMAAVGLCATSASALQNPFTQEKVQVQGHIQGGIYLGDDEWPAGDINPYGFGLGIRGGYTLRQMPFYLGGLLDYNIGEKEDYLPIFGSGYDVRVSSLIFQVEAGYDLGVASWVVVRPKIGLGLTSFLVNCDVINCDNDTDFAFQIGVEAPMEVGPVFVSPDFRFNIVGDRSALIIGAGVGGAF